MKSPTTQEASRWVGRVLRDKWRIDARIARGGVGTVFAATHKNNGNRIAIKVLHPEFSRDQDTRSRFLQEGYAANQVNHPGVVRILDDDVTEEGLAFLVMELLEGELLEKRRVRKQGRLPQNEVYEIADQLLDVLASAHEKGIVHRDIKPDNLFLTKEGRLKVLDFGFAQMKTGFRKEQTATGFLLGTPGFMSPEQAVGNRAQIDAATDIWAVGATLFTCLSGYPVHKGDSAAEMLVAAANFPARSLLSIDSSVAPKLAEIVDRALAFDKKQRWPNARAMQIALRTVPGRQTIGSQFESGRRSVEQPPSQPRKPPPLPAAGRAADEQITLMEAVEEVDASALAGPPSWQTDQRTVVAGAPQPLPKEAMPSIARPFGRGDHPADEDGPTLHVSGPSDVEPMTVAPLTPMMQPPRPITGSGPVALSIGGPVHVPRAPSGSNPIHRPSTGAGIARPPTGSVPSVSSAPAISSGAVPPRMDGTMIMDSAPMQPSHLAQSSGDLRGSLSPHPSASGPIPAAGNPSHAPMPARPSMPEGGFRPSSPSAQQPVAFGANQGSGFGTATPPKPFGAFAVTREAPFERPPETKRLANQRPDDGMMFVAGPARPAPPSPQGKRVLVFVAVAAISMIIVVVTGLLVIAASD